jgi:GntR family transcriptional regulator/MocR family aminotransferase
MVRFSFPSRRVESERTPRKIHIEVDDWTTFMSKRSATLPHTLRPRGDRESVTRWLADALRGAILGGQLRPTARLPSTRDLARQYGVARGTAVAVFETLAAEGYVTAGVGSGTYVSEAIAVAAPGAPPRKGPRRVRRLSAFARRARVMGSYPEGAARAFRTDSPALDLFPTELWARVAARRLRRVTQRELLCAEPLGHRPLREAVADYLRTARGVRCEVDQILIVAGLQEALDLVARLLLRPGDRVAIEDPGYIGAARTFAAWGARLRPTPIDGEGMAVPGGRGEAARLAYVTPQHQFPLGTAMTLPRRLALLDWARRTGALILEDDYDSEFRFSGRPLPALQGLDRHGTVLFAGSFSKVLFPALRLGYLVLPRDLADVFATTASITTRHAPVQTQAVLCDFLRDGHFGRHVARMREIYAARLGALQEAERSELAGALELSPIEAGLQTAAWLAPNLDDHAVARAAAARGVETTPLSRYAMRRLPRGGLQLGFAAVDEKEIRRGARMLAAAIEEVAATRPHRA